MLSSGHEAWGRPRSPLRAFLAILSSEPLAVAIVEHLVFHCRLLRLLGRGWSPTDAVTPRSPTRHTQRVCHSRSSVPAPAPRAGGGTAGQRERVSLLITATASCGALARAPGFVFCFLSPALCGQAFAVGGGEGICGILTAPSRSGPPGFFRGHAAASTSHHAHQAPNSIPHNVPEQTPQQPALFPNDPGDPEVLGRQFIWAAG